MSDKDEFEIQERIYDEGKRLDLRIDNSNKRISELEQKLWQWEKDWEEHENIFETQEKQIAELKEQLQTHDKEKFRDLCHPTATEYIDTIVRSLENREVLQAFMKAFRDNEDLTKLDPILDKLLKKLDGEQSADFETKKAEKRLGERTESIADSKPSELERNVVFPTKISNEYPEDSEAK